MPHRLPVSSSTTLAFLATLQVCACDEPPTPSSRRIPEVTVVTVRPQRVALTTELPGRTSPSSIAKVRPQVGGLIVARRFREGTDVKAGELLYQIDPAPYRAEYSRSRAALAMAETRLVLLRQAVERYDELGIQVLSQREVQLAAAALRQGVADVAEARAALHGARARLDRTRVTAPIAGRIGRSTVVPGTLVVAGQESALASLEQLDPIDVDVALPASALLRLDRALEAGQLPPGGDRAVTVGLELADGSVYPLKGELRFSEITVDASTGKATLPAVFPNPMGKLLPGMLVRALLDEGTVPDAILVPKPAVTGDGNGGPMTYVVDIEGKLEARKVVIERELGDRWLVTAGLKPGDRVVVEGVKHAPSRRTGEGRGVQALTVESGRRDLLGEGLLRHHRISVKDPPAMEQRIVIVLACLASACQSGAAAPAPPPPPRVEVVEVVRQDVPIRAEWIATLDGYVNAQIQPQVTGYLMRQNYVEGSLVKRGDVLFEIDARPFQAALDQARGQHAQAEAQRARAARDVERDRPLAEARAIARSQLENDVQAELGAAAAVDSARASVRTARLNVEFTKVRSLTDGIAGIARGQLGDLVGPATVLTTVSRLDPIKAYVAISEREYLRFVGGLEGVAAEARQPFPDAGTPLDLFLEGGTPYPHPGKFVLADRQVDPTTGTIRIAAAFPNPGNILRPGQFGRVRATLAVKRGALLVPQRAVSELQGTFQIAVVGKDNKIAIRPVVVGGRTSSMWIVEKGLAAGERVVAEGVQKVRDGASVTPVPYQSPAKG